MAESPSLAQNMDSNPNQLEPDKANPAHQHDQLPHPPPQQQSLPVTVNPHSNPPLSSSFPSFPSYAPAPMSSAGVALSAPSFRAVSVPMMPQFSTGPNYMNPPGVSSGQPMMNGGAPAQMVQYQVTPGQLPNPAMRHYAPMPAGYAPQGTMPHPGIPRYSTPYMPMLRPAFAPRPLGTIGMPPGVSRPLVPGVSSAHPIAPSIIRPPIIPIVTLGEKPQTTVYVGKIASSVENDYMLNLLQICGLVKGWKRAEDPTTGTPKGFGFCEFASAEGVLRALRLLNKFNIDGQELMLNVNQGTKEYLERYVEKKTEISKKLKAEEGGKAPSAENNEPAKASVGKLKKDDNHLENKETQYDANFGIVTEEDMEADKVASEKIASKIEERLKSRPLPPPPPFPPPAADLPVRSRDAESDVDTDATKDKGDDDSDKPSEQDRPETSSPDRSRRNDRRSSRDRERDLKRDKERETDRYEKEADRERIRKERDQRRKIEEAEREFGECLKEWEYRESKREKARQYEKEREKEREHKRKREILEEEEEEDSRKRGRRNEGGKRRKRTLWERDEDLSDKQKEEEEIAEAKKKAEEELKKQEEQQKDALKLLSSRVANGSEKTIFTEEWNAESKYKTFPQDYREDASNDHENHKGDGISQNGIADDSIMTSVTVATHLDGNAPAKKLGFDLVGSEKKTTVPCVFHEEDDDDAQKDKKMRPLVPIDYSTEELQAVQPTSSEEQPSNLAAAAEFAKRISNVNSKEEKHDQERERSRRSYDRSSQRDRDRNDEDANRPKDDNKKKLRDRDREHGVEKAKTPDNKKLLDAKQLIDMIPKTKEELFSYEINWAVYDKHKLHERMRPWISKKIMEFLGEEELTLVNYIVSSTQEHVKASQMLEQLQSILDEEAEMFVLKMWRMLIFEVKKVETGLSLKSRT